MGFMVERSANGATENKLYTQSYEIFRVIWGAPLFCVAKLGVQIIWI